MGVEKIVSKTLTYDFQRKEVIDYLFEYGEGTLEENFNIAIHYLL